MICRSTQILAKEAAEIDDYVSYACKYMQQQLANSVIENAIKGECIVSIDNSPMKEEDPDRNAVKMTLTCRIQKLVRCKHCEHHFTTENYMYCRKHRSFRLSPDFFCADGKEEEK